MHSVELHDAHFSVKLLAPPSYRSSGALDPNNRMVGSMKIREWINRDNGEHFQIGNRAIGWLEATGVLTVIAALVLWQLHTKLGLSIWYAAVAAIIGLGIAVAGNLKIGAEMGPAKSFECDARSARAPQFPR